MDAEQEIIEALAAFPDATQHNLCSTATQKERTAFISKVIQWRNNYIDAIENARALVWINQP